MPNRPICAEDALLLSLIHISKLMLAAGETYPGLLDSLITLALERAGGVHD